MTFPDFKVLSLSRDNRNINAKRNSGGIAIYIREKYFTPNMLFKSDSDDILWIKFDGKLFEITSDVFLCFGYITPSDSSREALIETSVFDRISDHIIEISGETHNNYHLIVCGDLNCRSGTEPDYVMYDKPDNMPVLPEDYESDVPLDRFSQDHFININGRKLLDFCKLNSLRICNGRLGQDRGIGKYTYIGGTGSSVVDYVLVSESIFNFISKFSIGDPNILSDHCEVTFSISDVRFEAQSSEETMQMGERIRKNLSGTRKKVKLTNIALILTKRNFRFYS